MSGKTKKMLAACVHLYTAMGLALAFWAAMALVSRDPVHFMAALWLAVFIDSTDGFFARKLDVKRVLPWFDGRKLDDIIDYLTFAFLPCVGMATFDLISEKNACVVVLALIASGYGFCRENAKTEESFVGFPSYWNVLFLYLFILKPPGWVSMLLVLALSILVFIPVRFVYPSRTRWLKKYTVGFGIVYALLLLAICLNPFSWWAQEAALISLPYPLYYLVISLMHHARTGES